MIRFTCEQCGKKLKATPEQAGARFKCTDCGTVSRVPRWSEEVGREDAQRVERAAAAEWKVTSHDDAEPPVEFKKRPPLDQEMDMTPMVDCVFQLLIFFMVTASFVMQKSMEVPKPDPTAEASQRPTEQQEEDDSIIVRVDQDSVIWVDDREAKTRHELIARLRDKAQAADAPKKLLVSFHPEARTDRVILGLDAGMAVKLSPSMRPDEEGF
jgi:biopolymer transport protein ExbD